MPIYEYQAAKAARSCPFCADGFEWVQKIGEQPLVACPKCGVPVRKVLTAPRVGQSKSGLDHRAKSAGFHKLERCQDGNYLKKY